MSFGRSVRVGATLAVALAAVVAVAPIVNAETPPLPAQSQTIRGQGGDTPGPIFNYWFGKYKNAYSSSNTTLTYTMNGAGAGVKAMQANPPQTDYAGAPTPMTDADLAGVTNGRTILHVPSALGAIVLGIKLSCASGSITLTAENVGDLFSGAITNWNDARLRTSGRNPSLASCNVHVTTVHRSDSSGATYVFTEYLKQETTSYWANKSSLPTRQYNSWPVGIGEPHSSAVALKVKQTNGAIGFLETSYAKSAGLKKAKIQNGDHTAFVAATAATVTAAAKTASVPSDLRIQPIIGAPGANSYPLSTYMYWYVFQQEPTSAAHGKTLISYIYWALTTGQQYASALGYAKLPSSVKTLAINQLKKITYNGTQIWTP